eukprot:6683787-Pyramimonas_sp.AAC.1
MCIRDRLKAKSTRGRGLNIALRIAEELRTALPMPPQHTKKSRVEGPPRSKVGAARGVNQLALELRRRLSRAKHVRRHVPIASDGRGGSGLRARLTDRDCS